jgi:hypothetical protein
MSTEKYLLPNEKQRLLSEAKAPKEYIDFQSDDKSFEVYQADNNGESSASPAEKASKNWPTGAPVVKTFKRVSKAPIPKGEFWVLESDYNYYWLVKGSWYSISKKDFDRPPFDY